MYRITILVLTFVYYLDKVLPYTIDQRQTGDLNVQVDLKNLNLIALMKGKEEYVDYDYAYDYSDITIKPQNNTTKKPLNVTEITTQPYKVNETLTTTINPNSNFEANVSEVYTTTESTFNYTDHAVTDVYIKIEGSTASSSSIPQSIDPTLHNTSAVEGDGCKKGFFRNTQGVCEYRLQNPSNTLLKMIKQKQKANRGNYSQ